MAIELQRITEPDSSMVEKLQYNYATHTLYVTFKNGWLYQYEDVPAITYAQVNAAESVGRAFNAQIKNKYTYHRIMNADG